MHAPQHFAVRQVEVAQCGLPAVMVIIVRVVLCMAGSVNVPNGVGKRSMLRQ